MVPGVKLENISRSEPFTNIDLISQVQSEWRGEVEKLQTYYLKDSTVTLLYSIYVKKKKLVFKRKDSL